MVVEKQLSDVDEDCHGASLDKVITKKNILLELKKKIIALV